MARHWSAWQIGKRHYIVTLADTYEAHAEALQYGGGRDGIGHIDNLKGAIGRPYHGYHRPIARKAAALFHGVATSHGFIDANKRTAWLLAFLLIERSGYYLDIAQDYSIEDIAVNVVEGTMSEDQLVDWFRQWIIARE